MDFSRLRLPVALAVALVLGAGVGVVPAQAGTTLVTVQGHVTNAAGKPLSGIEVDAGCGCDDQDAHHDAYTTTSNGYYSVIATTDDFLSYTDHDARYFSASKGVPSGSAVRVVDVTLERISIISGRITGAHGAEASGAEVRLYDATTGKLAGEGDVEADGRYVAQVRDGSYKVRFGGGAYITEQWYGGAATREASATVTVGDGATTTGIDATVQPEPTISGTVTIDGRVPLEGVKERLHIALVDSGGTEVDSRVSPSVFSFVHLTPGTYTLILRPTLGSGQYAQPLARKVTLKQGTAISRLTIDLTSMPASAASTRSTGVTLEKAGSGVPTSGSVLKAKIIVASYGDVTGGKVLIYVNGVEVDSRTVPASGRINWKTRLGTVTLDAFTVKVRFLGTDTARSRSQIVYAPTGP